MRGGIGGLEPQAQPAELTGEALRAVDDDLRLRLALEIRVDDPDR